jgi:hypothetical protein
MTQTQITALVDSDLRIGDPRSVVYRDGALAAVRFRLHSGGVVCPHAAGTVEYDAWFAGAERGHSIAREILEAWVGESVPMKNRVLGWEPDQTKAQDDRKREYSSVNKQFLLSRGWTRTAIKRILGEPDRHTPMVQFRKDRPECRYEMERVIAAENAGLTRFRKAGDRFMPGTNAPEALWDAMLAAGSARARRGVMRVWAKSEGMPLLDAIGVFILQKED